MLTAAPDNAERTDLQILRVRCLAALERLADARAIMSTVITGPRHASDVSAWIMYGNICDRLEDPTRLRQAVARILSLAPDRPEGYSLRAMQMH